MPVINFEIDFGRLKIHFNELDFSNLIFQNSSTDQHGVWPLPGRQGQSKHGIKDCAIIGVTFFSEGYITAIANKLRQLLMFSYRGFSNTVETKYLYSVCITRTNKLKVIKFSFT